MPTVHRACTNVTYLSRTLAVLPLFALGGCYSGVAGNGAGEGASSASAGSADGGSSASAGDGASDGSGSEAGDAGSEDAGSDGGGSAPTHAVAPSGMRRLTIDEYDNTLRDLLLDDSRSSDLLLPKDVRNPFDNDFTEQIPSQALIEGAYLLAADAAGRLLADASKRDQVVGCVPAGPDDAVCFGQFIDAFGRRALRRPLTPIERDTYLALLDYGIETGDFYTAVDTAVRAFLQDPEFLYRVELGEPVAGEPGMFRLDDWEVGTRLSYFLWGSTSPDWLLDRAEEASLTNTEGIRSAALELLADARAQTRIDRFHALWLGYENLPHAADLSMAMRAETDALIKKVVFDDDLPYAELFTATETFLDDKLADHYGLPRPGGSTWVGYGDSGRAGILSHGSFLSVAGKFGDTSPTQRGILIRTRLFCQDIPPPPPDVNVDDEVPTTETVFCKYDRYAAHRQGGCASCHNLTDPIGFGLENYDQQGRYRTHEADDPDTSEDESTCVIAGDGELVGIGSFRGPAELGQLMLDSGLVERCVATQLYRFAMGRYELDQHDLAFIDLLQQNVGTPGFHFADLAVEFVANEAFRFRREQP